MATNLILNDNGRISFAAVDFLISNEEPGQAVVALRVVGVNYVHTRDAFPMVALKRRGIAALRFFAEAYRSGMTVYIEPALAMELFRQCAAAAPLPADLNRSVAEMLVRHWEDAGGRPPEPRNTAADPIAVVIGTGLLPFVDSGSELTRQTGDCFVYRIVTIRENLPFAVPTVRVCDDPLLPPDGYRITIYGEPVATGTLWLDKPAVPNAMVQNPLDFLAESLKTVLIQYQDRFVKEKPNGG